jgi:hypothetical protein
MNVPRNVLVCLLFALSIAGIGNLSAKKRAQEVAFERLHQEREKLQKLSDENLRLKSVVIDPAEIERLRRATAILLKLRNEFGTLTQSKGDSAAPRASTEDNIEKLLVEREQILDEEQQIHQLSDRATCIKNLEQIALAKVRWAKDKEAEKGLPVVMETLIDYLPERAIPVCPAGGHYSVNRTGAAPGCSIEGHSIP